MGAFINGINNGFMTGMLSYMSGGFAPFCRNFFAFNSFPVFSAPMPAFNYFQCLNLSIQQPAPMNFSFNPPPMDFSFNTQPTQPVFDFNMNFTPNTNFTYNTPDSIWNFTSTQVPKNTYYTDNYAPVLPKKSDSKPVKKTSKKTVIASHTANELFSKWSKRKISKDAQLSPEFCEKVIQISKRINCDADDLMTLMYHESRFNHTTCNYTNKKPNVGLIQFGELSRIDLKIPGKTDEEKVKYIQNLDPITQLDYVEKYFMLAREHRDIDISEPLSLYTMAALAFRPAYAKAEYLAVKGEDAYKHHRRFDTNNDGKISRKEFEAEIRKDKA